MNPGARDRRFKKISRGFYSTLTVYREVNRASEEKLHPYILMLNDLEIPS